MRITFILPLLLLCFLSIDAKPMVEKDTLGEVTTIHVPPHRGKGEIILPKITGQKIGATIYQRNPNPRFRGHWSGYYYGFLNLTSPDEPYPGSVDPFAMDGGTSFTMQFNFAQYNICLSRKNNFGIVTGFGFEYQRFRFEYDNSITKNEQHGLSPIYYLDTDVKRSSLKNLYLSIPALLEWQFPARKKQRAYLSAGAVASFRLHTKTKVVYNDENGKKHKQKDSGNFYVNPVKVDLQARIGYRAVCLWGSYSLTRTFEKDKAPDLHSYSIGIGITI